MRLPGGTPYRVEEHPVDSARSNPGGPPPLRSRVAFASEGADSVPGPNDRLDRDYVSSKPIEDAKEKEQEVKKGVNRKSLAERFSHMQVAGTEDAMARHAEKRYAAQSERFRKKKRGDEGYNSDEDGAFYDWELYDKKKSVGEARNAWDKDGNPLAVIKGRRLTLAELRSRMQQQSEVELGAQELRQAVELLTDDGAVLFNERNGSVMLR